MATPHKRRDGQVIDLDSYVPASDREALELVQDILDRAEDDDAERGDMGAYQLEKIQRVLWVLGIQGRGWVHQEGCDPRQSGHCSCDGSE